MTAKERVGLAFCCFLLGFALFGVWGTVPTAIRYGPRQALPSLEILPLYFIFAVPGFLLALPVVLWLKDAEGTRTPIILALGASIGPAFITGWAMLASGGHFSWRADGTAFVMSLWIGLPTTIAYVLILRCSARSHPKVVNAARPLARK